MPRPRKNKKVEDTNEILDVAEETASQDLSNEEKFVVEAPVVVEKPKVEEPKVEEPKVEHLKVEEPAAEVVQDGPEELANLTNKLNSELKKANTGLTAHLAKVANNITYILIKAANSAYCFARLTSGREGSRAQLEIEFLSNVPADAHRQIMAVADSLNIQNSKRLFFHPSGIL